MLDIKDELYGMVSNLHTLKRHNAEFNNIKISPDVHPDSIWYKEPFGTHLNIESDKWPYVDKADDLSRRNSCGWESRDPSRRVEAPLFSTIYKYGTSMKILECPPLRRTLRLATSSNFYGIVARFLTRFWGDTMHNSCSPRKI